MVCPICGLPRSGPWEECGATGPSPVAIIGQTLIIGRMAMPYYAKERLYLTLDGKVVNESDPAAATLFLTVGDELSDEDARKHGLTGRKAAAPADASADGDGADTPEAEAEVKAVEVAPANKARRIAPADKGA